MGSDMHALSSRTSVSRLISGTLAIELLADTIRFRDFLKEHSIRRTSSLLPGLKLVFEMVIDESIQQVERGNAFTLDSDPITQRAIFKGIDINKIRSQSQLAKVIRGLRTAENIVTNESTIPDFQAAISEQLENWIESVNILFSNHSLIAEDSCKDMSKENVKNLQTFSWLLLFLNIISRVYAHLRMKKRFGIPKKAKNHKKQFEKAFHGYKVALAYVWNSLEGSFLPEAPIAPILQTRNWDELDSLFNSVADGPVKQADTRLGSSWCAVFQKESEYNNERLESIMIEADLTKEEEQNVLLDHSFLWYDFEILDTAGKKLFAGVPTFVHLLLGAIMSKRIYKSEDSVEVRRILHPVGSESNYLSYAILVPMFSSAADYSGWLVNLECCTDYSGFGNSLRSEADAIISAYQQDISFEEIIVDSDYFRQYLKEKLEAHGKNGLWSNLTPSERERLDLEKSITLGTDLSAVIMELFVAVTLAEMDYSIHWQFRHGEIMGEREIDILAYNDHTVQIIECSRHMPLNQNGISKLSKELKRKESLIRKSEFSRKSVLLRYITNKNIEFYPFNTAAQELRREGIIVENINDLIQQSKHRTKPLLDLLQEIDLLRNQRYSGPSGLKSQTYEGPSKKDNDEIRRILHKYSDSNND